MTRQEAINRWTEIARTVFRAEDSISHDWFGRLEEAAKLPIEQQYDIADEYCEAIATEIVSRTTDEELAKME